MEALLAMLLTLAAQCSAQTVSLGLNLEVGKEYYQSSDARMIIAQEIENQYYTMTNLVKGDYTFKVLSESKGVYEADVSYGFLEVNLELSGRRMVFSSLKADKDDIFSLILSRMVGVPFRVRIDRMGKVLEIIGLDRLADSMTDQFSELPEEELSKLKTQVQSAFGADSFKGSFEMLTAIYPEKRVKMGDVWPISTKLSGPLSASMDGICTLSSADGDKVILSGRSTFNSMTNNDPNSNITAQNLRGTMNSEFQLDRKSGWIASATIKQEFEAETIIRNNPMFPDGITIPMACSSEMRVSGHLKK